MPKKSSSTYKIQNIVATTSLEKPLPLTKLARTQPNTEYNPETFPGLVLRIKEPKSAVLVFSSGNLVCTGTKSIAEVKRVIQEVIKQLKKINIHITAEDNSPEYCRFRNNQLKTEPEFPRNRNAKHRI